MVAQNPIPEGQLGMPTTQLNIPTPAVQNNAAGGMQPSGTPTIAPPRAVPEGVSPTVPQGSPAPQAGSADEYTAGFPGMLPPGQPVEGMPPSEQGVDTGLWQGCEPDNGCAVCGGGYCQPPLWFTDQGARIINRSRARRVTLATETRVGLNSVGQLANIQADVFNTRNVNYDAAPGYYATIGRYLGRDSQDRDDFAEFSYWGMNTWSDAAFFTGSQVTPVTTDSQGNQTGYPLGRPISVGNLNSQFPTLVVGFNRANYENISVSSEMHNWELNLRLRPRGRPDQLILHPNGRWRHECQPGAFMSYLVGLRYMTIGDGFNWHTQGLIEDPTGTGSHFVSGDYNVKTENDLLGLQIGTDLIFRRCKWSWGVRAKVGPYINFARDVQEIRNQGNDPFGYIMFNDRFSTMKQKVALIGEVGFEANYKFTPTLTGRVGYDFMWISGLALAPEQLQFTDAPGNTINTNGSVFSQGLTMSLNWSW
jgi:hypothetical protein